MKPSPKSRAPRKSIKELESRLREAEETLDAIRCGHVDALVVQGPDGAEQVFTLKGVDQRYRQLVEAMNEGAVLVGRDGMVVYANKRFAAMVGRELDRLLGRRIHELMSPVLAESLLESRDQPVTAEGQLSVANGLELPVYISATSGWDADADLRCVIVTDLSRQKRDQQLLSAERLTSQIIEQAAEGIVVCDLDGCIVRASNVARELAAPANLFAPFERVFDLRDDGGRSISRELVTTAISGSTTTGLEVSLFGRRDGPTALLLSSAPIKADGSGVVGCVVSFADITARKNEAIVRSRLLEDSNTARREAENANSAKDEFLAMLGHELRNPLAPIVTALDLMDMRSDPSSLRERKIIQRHVTHVVRLVDDLMDVARIAQGKVQLDKARVELALFVRKAIEAASPLIEERGHRLVVELANDLYVDGDETRLCQIVSNLLTNAAKYTPKGGTIELRGRQDGSWVVVTVRDNGVGIAPELLPTLFDVFVQGKRSLDRSEGGLGLGLAIVRSLASLHGGSIKATSAGHGRGSEFELRLPLSVANAEQVRPATSFVARTDGKRVLVVDDNEDAANMLADVLTMLGHEVRTAYDGPSALELEPQFKPDIAILDIGLPVMDGYELAGFLRKTSNRVPKLVALTGYGTPSDRERTTAAGFDAHMVKPVTMDVLTSTLEMVFPTTVSTR